MQSVPDCMNDSGTLAATRAESVQSCSLPVLINALTRARPAHPAPHLVTTLIEQCKRFDSNPVEMRKKILRTIEAIERAA